MTRLRSVTATWGVLVALDLASRARFLLPRLATLRGALNYVGACVALWVVVRLLAALSGRLRLAAFALVVAVPMAVQWAMFRAYGQFVEPTDLVTLADSPRVALAAIGASAGTYGLGLILVATLSVTSAWLLPREPRPLRLRMAILASSVLFASFLLGSSYWRASPTLEHSQPAFGCSIAGLLHRATVLSRAGKHVTVPPMLEPAGRPNIVLVVGESLAASHLGLYGYERDTSPLLQALAGRGALFALRDATVMGPNTRTSVPYILTGLEGPDVTGRIFRAPTVLEYAKARGYHTAFVSAQEESWGNFDVLFREGADTFRTGIEFAADVDVMRGADDITVLEQGVLPTLRAIPEPFFVVLHMNGSHAPYAYHSPASRKAYLPEDGVNSVNAYDNTVRVTDEYVSRVFETLRARDPEAWMFFTSDHGQALGEGGAFFNHGYQSNVVRDPLLVFPPRSEAGAHERYDELARAQVAACDLAPTILHLMHASPVVPMDCDDWMAAPPAPRVRVVSAYTPAFVAEPTMLVVRPDGRRELYDLGRGTVVGDDGIVLRSADVTLPPAVAARLGR